MARSAAEVVAQTSSTAQVFAVRSRTRTEGDRHGTTHRERRVARELTIEDLCNEFLARGRAKNLSPRTIEWYERHARAFARRCASKGIVLARELECAHLDDFLVAMHGTGVAANTVRGAAQTIKALSRFGFRKGHIPTEITRDFEMPRVPQVIVETFTDDQLRALMAAPDKRKWVGLRDRAMLMLFLD